MWVHPWNHGSPHSKAARGGIRGAGLWGSLLLGPEGPLMVLCGSDQAQVDAGLFWGATGDSDTLFSVAAAQDSKDRLFPLNRSGWEKSLCWDGPSWVFKAAQCHGGDNSSAVPVGVLGHARRSKQIFYVKMLSPTAPKARCSGST